MLTMTLGTPTTPLTSGGVAIAWTLEDANHTLVGRAGTTPIITVTITDAGVYTVTLTGPVDHPIANQEDIVTFSVPVNVSDGQATTPTSLSITIEDDTPTVTANAAVQLDDDALTGGNAGGIVDVNPDTANTTGTLAHSYGADGAGTTLLTTAGAVLPSGFTPTVTDGGRTLTISQIQNGVSVAVLQVQLSDTTSGIYTVTQLHAIDHPAGLDENDLTFTVNYVTTDHDGDTATSSLSINVNDDTPTVTANAAVQLDDDALTGGNAGGIVDVNPDTANTTGTLAHSYGADGAGTTLLTTAGAVLPSGFTPTVTDGGRTLTISQIQNGVSVAVLQVQLSDTTSGIYTVTQLHAIDHPAGLDENDLTFTVNYVTTDHDGDTATSSLSINVNDDTPTVTANAAVQLDDDALTGGNAGGIVDVNPDTANTTGTLAHSYGADGAGTTLLTTAGAVLPSGFTPTVTDGGRTLTISQIQNGVSVAVLQVQLSDTTSGIYTVTQLHAIDHPAGLDENDLTFTVNYVTTDHDGDTATSSLSINVNDDTPTVTANAAVQLDDDALTGGNAGGIVDVNPDTANTTGTLAHSYGADGAGTTLLTTAGAVLPSGFTPTVTDGGRTLTISQIQNGVSVAVLQVQLSDTTSGIYTVTQLHAIDHPAGLDENDLTFTVNYVTTDHDGDTATSSLSINVNDDTPTVTANAAVQLDDDALTGGNAGGIVDVNPDTANTTGTLAHSYGADGAGTTLLTTAGAVLPSGFTPTVTDGGRTLTISQIQNGVSVAVLQVQLSDTTSGIYTVTQLHAIDHPAGLDENDLTFTVNYVTTDHDGDTATSSLSINVNDDTPTVTANAAVQLDDDALTGGNAGGIVDVNPDTANTTGTLAHSYGADGAGTTLLTTAGAVLPSGFTPTVTDGGRTLTISQIQNGVSVAVLQVQLSDTTSGIYTVTQLHAIDHPAGLDENDLTFTVNYVTTDHDGDTATSSLSINVNDDTPVAISPQHAFLPDNATATVTVALDGDGQIDNNVGADQAGTLTFVNITNGEDSGFTSGGDPILLFVTGDGTLLEGRTGSSSGPLVFTVILNHNLGGSDTYTVTMLDSVDNGSGVIFTDLSGGKAGNAPFKIISQSGVLLELLFTPINGSSVSSDSDDVGIAPSQFVDPGQGLRIDFGDFTSSPNGLEKIEHPSPVNGFQFTIEQISNGAHADVRLRAVDANEDSNFANDTTVAITEIQIYDSSGVLVDITSSGIVVVFEPDGTVLITGLPAAYSVLTKTASGYDRIEITNAGGNSPGDGKFSVGELSVEQTLVGHDVNMTFDVALTDADGNSVVSQIDITLTANSVAPAGVAGEPINLRLTAPFNLTSDGHGGTLISDPPTSTTPDATVTPVVETTTLTTTETAGSQTDVSSATVDEGTVVARSTAVLDPDGGETTSMTINGNGAVADTTGTASGSGSLMVNSGTALELTSISHKLAGILTDNGRVEVTNPHTLARTALSREPGTLATFERQIAIASIIIVVEYLADSFKLASAGDGGMLMIDAAASSDATLEPVSKTPTVAATDTVDARGTPVAADEGAIAALDAAITPDGGLSDLTIGSLPSGFALTESEGDEPTVAHDTISLAYSEFTDLGLHRSGTDHATTLDVATATSDTASWEAGSDGNSKTGASLSSSNSISLASMDANGGDAAHIHSAVAGYSSTIDTVGTTIPDSVSSSFRGATSGHVNDQPHFENASPGTLQSLESPTQAASHAADIPPVAAVEDANGGHAAHSHGVAAEHSFDIPATTIADSGAPGLRGEPPGHANDQPQLGNANPGNNGLGHQPRELPSQAVLARG